MDKLASFTCIERANRQVAEEAIKVLRTTTSSPWFYKCGGPQNTDWHDLNKGTHMSGTFSPTPTFIWVASPQAAVVMIKLISQICESTPPPRPANIKGGGTVRDHNHRYVSLVNTGAPVGRAETRFFSPSRLSRRDQRLQDSPLGRISDLIINQVNFNPSIELYDFTSHLHSDRADKKHQELVQAAIQTSIPHISELKIDPRNAGQPLKLRRSYSGHLQPQHPTNQEEAALQRSCGPVWDYGDFVFISERPTQFNIERTTRVQEIFSNRAFPTTQGVIEDIRLHSLTGPAIEWSDGFKIYAVRGVVVPEFVIEKPQLINLFKINHEENAEVRRIMTDRYKFGQSPSGAAAYMLDSGAQKVDHDDQWGTLWHLPQQNRIIRSWAFREEDMTMLEVVNRTPEPDGSFKHYFLRVPPQMRSSKQAAAWTFGFDEDEYNPIKES